MSKYRSGQIATVRHGVMIARKGDRIITDQDGGTVWITAGSVRRAK
jgi:hypothetical protein